MSTAGPSPSVRGSTAFLRGKTKAPQPELCADTAPVPQDQYPRQELPSLHHHTNPLLKMCWGWSRARSFLKGPAQLQGGSAHRVEEAREGQKPEGGEKKGETMALKKRCQEKMGWGEVVTGYRCNGEEVLAQQTVPMASSGKKTHTQTEPQSHQPARW